MKQIKSDRMFNIWDENDPVIRSVYEKDNFIIREYDNDSDIAAIYFASNRLYYPDTEEQFRKEIIENDRYEWMNLHRENVRKEIFLRDIYKCHYVLGINSRINSIEKLIEFLKEETRGLKVITVGSSAGGYAATVLGTCLQAYMVFSFSGQNDIGHYMEKPLSPAAKNRDNPNISKYYNVGNMWKCMEVPYTFYFYSGHNDGDIRQCKELIGISDYVRFFPFCFDTDIHAETMYNFNMPMILSLDRGELEKLCRQYKDLYIRRFDFSIKVCGIRTTVMNALYKLYRRIAQKMKSGS